MIKRAFCAILMLIQRWYCIGTCYRFDVGVVLIWYSSCHAHMLCPQCSAPQTLCLPHPTPNNTPCMAIASL